MQSKKTPAAAIALGGMLAALAAVIMALGTLIPVATYVCPVLCILLCRIVLTLCGSRVAWAWYAAAALLSLLFAPDKEAAVIFLFLGYYPILKPKLDAGKGKWLWKALLFNGATLAAYFVVIRILGLDGVAEEFQALGRIMTVVLLILGNVTFFLLDRLLGMGLRRKR